MREQEPQGRWVETGGIRLHYREWPGAEPTLLCMHDTAKPPSRAGKSHIKRLYGVCGQRGTFGAERSACIANDQRSSSLAI